MTERITADEVQEWANEDRFGPMYIRLLRLAAQTRADTAKVEHEARRMANVTAECEDRGYRIRQLREAIEAINTVKSESHCASYKVWIPGEDNHLETLVCPVVIPAEWLRNIVEERDTLAAKVAEYEEALSFSEARIEANGNDRIKSEGELMQTVENLLAKVTEYEERMKGRVLVPVNMVPALIPGRAWFDIDHYSVIGTFATKDEGRAALQAIIDKEDSNA